MDEMKRLKNECSQYLQSTGKLSAQNCVLFSGFAITNFSFFLVDVSCYLFCFFVRVGHKIKKEDIVCQKLMMEMFIQCGIVEKATSVKTLLTLLKICENV